MKNIVGIKWNCYKGFDFKDAIKGISSTSFKYLEIPSRPNNTFGIYPGISDKKIEEIKETFNKYNIVPISMGSYVNVLDNNPSEFEKILEFSNIFNCKYIVISIDDAKSNVIKDETIVAESLRLLIPLLEKYDKILVMELHGKYCNGKILDSICKETNSNRVKTNYDTGNAIFYGLSSSEELIDDINNHLDTISYFHLKDKLGLKDEWNFPALGKGYVPFERIFEILKNKSNNSPLFVEIEFTADGVNNIDEVNKAVIDSADYLKKKGIL